MKKWFAGALMLAFAIQSEALVVPRGLDTKSMNQNAREVFHESMNFSSRFWDQNAKLVFDPADTKSDSHTKTYMVRESTWYAVGLLMRDAAGDRTSAVDILDTVLKQQYLVPGAPWYGTFKRTPDEPTPPQSAVMWKDFDPNWREFIGTAFAVILIEYPDRIPSDLSQRMYAAINRSIEGELKEARLLPSYSNIALMYGFLWNFAALHDNRADWRKQSLDWTESVYQLFKAHNSFYEYNSPTYYGVDLYGLALWRDYGSTERIRTMGSEMESTLWNDIASFYQPNIRNMSGPYDRSYGMDMESYVSIVGIWMRTALSAKAAPLPKITNSTDHVEDIFFTPLITLLGTRIPAKALEKMTVFEGDHLLYKQISNERAATAWIGHDVIFGGEATNKTKDAGTTTQFHPATIQWRTPSQEIGWVQLVSSPNVDVIADKRGLNISTTGTIRLRIHAKDLMPSKIAEDKWDLPGISITIHSDAKNFHSQVGQGYVDVIYSGLTNMKLGVNPK